MKQWIIKIVIAHILVLGLGFGFAAYPLGWFNTWLADKPAQIIHLSCADLSLGCTFYMNQQTYIIKSKQPISTSEPVQLTVSGPAQSIRLSWAMQGMDMGSNHYKMLSKNQTEWQAETMLPICSQQRLDWLLTLEIDQSKVLIQTQSGPRK